MEETNIPDQLTYHAPSQETTKEPKDALFMAARIISAIFTPFMVPPFQRMCVRSSTTSYGSFNLDMDRSPGFGSTPTDSGPLKTWFPYGSTPEVLNLASKRNSPDRSTKSTRSHI